MKEAVLYRRLKGGTVQCGLCCHHCVIEPGKRGICMVRENHAGKLQSLVYGKVVSLNVDPVEKKPLYHFQPGSRSLSLSTIGCNLGCDHCQNHEISHYFEHHPDANDIPGNDTTSEEVAEAAQKTGADSISYTYTEPTVFFEFARDCMLCSKKKGIRNIFVSNGFMSPECANLAADTLDAINIDLKGGEDFYRNICKAKLGPVKENIELFHSLGVWVEVTTLIIPGLNDSEKELSETAGFLSSISPSIPWHLSAFFPTYRMTDRVPTSVDTLLRARKIGLQHGLQYVYLGNVREHEGADTICPGCQMTLIRRAGYSIEENRINNSRCPSCGTVIAGVWK